MSLWRHVTRGLRVLTNRAQADRDVADEVQHYFEQTAAALEAGGLSPEQARRAARVELGSVTVVWEEVRAYGWENMIETLFADVRYAVRRLCQRPGFTTVSLLTLALGIGSTTAIFSVINGVLLKPLPYAHPEQLVALWHTAPGVNIKDLNISPSLYFVYSDENRVFQDVSMWADGTSSVTGLAEPEEVPILQVTHRLLPVLAVQPALGRGFRASDDDPKGPRVVMLSDGYWKARFGGERSVVGRRIMIDGDAHEVIGVLPASFRFMDRRASLVTPLRFDRSALRLGNFSFQGLARLRAGVTLEQANADIRRMLPMMSERFPAPTGYSAKMFDDARIGPALRWSRDDLVGDIGDTLWVLMGTIGMVLLIACANVANLLLVRADGRHQELAIRAALGAGYGRIARELLLESLLLGIAGGALGLALAYEGLRLLAASELPNLPRIDNISIDPLVLAFALGISLAAGLGFGLIPVWKYARPHLASALRSGGRSLSRSKERNRARSILVVVQVALALILLVSSGLMIRTFQALRHVDPGFSNAHAVQTFRISIPATQVKEPERVLRMEQEILNRIAALPGVSSVAMTNVLPLQGGSNDPIYADDRTYREGQIPPIRRYKFVSPDYVSAMGSRLIAGREITWTETYNHRNVTLVPENLARELWRDPRAAIGKRIRSTLKDEWSEVIGVVANLHDNGVDQNAPTIVYWPLLQKNAEGGSISVRRSLAYVIRSPRAGSTGLMQEVRQTVSSVNPSLPVAEVRTLETIYDRSLARTSFTLVLLAIAGGMALLLGVIGIYGVVSYSVAQRTREIGIRLALGAPLQGVTGMFVRHGLVLSGVGAVCGLTAAFAVTRLMKSLLFDVSPADPLTYVAVSAGLILAAMIASYLPARRATAIDPVETLRAE
jgi:predicted permease